MNIPSTIETFFFSNTTVNAFVPTTDWLQKQLNNENKNKNTIPYWAQVWPASKALCEVITVEPGLVKDKMVLEIAAGLGLPSLLAAQFAKQVIATDGIKDAVELMKHSAALNHLQTMQCQLMDWNKPDKKIKPEIVLLSDVNYEPAAFEALYKLFSIYIEQGATILLSTPQRLIAKSFMDKLQQWRIKTYNIDVPHKNETVFTSVWVLKDNTHL